MDCLKLDFRVQHDPHHSLKHRPQNTTTQAAVFQGHCYHKKPESSFRSHIRQGHRRPCFSSQGKSFLVPVHNEHKTTRPDLFSFSRPLSHSTCHTVILPLHRSTNLPFLNPPLPRSKLTRSTGPWHKLFSHMMVLSLFCPQPVPSSRSRLRDSFSERLP